MITWSTIWHFPIWSYTQKRMSGALMLNIHQQLQMNNLARNILNDESSSTSTTTTQPFFPRKLGQARDETQKKQRLNDKKFIRKKNPAFHLSGDGAQHFDQATLSNNGRQDQASKQLTTAKPQFLICCCGIVNKVQIYWPK